MARRKKGRKTSKKGVYAMGPAEYRITVQLKIAGKEVTRERLISAASAEEASEVRAGLKRALQAELMGAAPERTNGAKLFGDFVILWLRTNKVRFTPETYRNYDLCLDKQLLPRFGGFRLDWITMEAVVKLREELQTKYMPNTVNQYLKTLRTVLNAAVKLRYLDVNVARAVPLLTVNPVKGESKIFEGEPNALDFERNECALFWEALYDRFPQHRAMTLLLFSTGLRMGAVRALRRIDLDFEEGVIHVRRRLSNGIEIQGVKRSRKVQKALPLLPEVAALLEEHFATFNPVQSRSGLVFPSRRNGRPHAASILARPFRLAIELAGLKMRFTPHGARRTVNDALREVTSETVTMRMIDHVTQAMHRRYSTVRDLEVERAARAAFGALKIEGSQDRGPDLGREAVNG